MYCGLDEVKLGPDHVYNMCRAALYRAIAVLAQYIRYYPDNDALLSWLTRTGSMSTELLEWCGLCEYSVATLLLPDGRSIDIVCTSGKLHYVDLSPACELCSIGALVLALVHVHVGVAAVPSTADIGLLIRLLREGWTLPGLHFATVRIALSKPDFMKLRVICIIPHTAALRRADFPEKTYEQLLSRITAGAPTHCRSSTVDLAVLPSRDAELLEKAFMNMCREVCRMKNRNRGLLRRVFKWCRKARNPRYTVEYLEVDIWHSCVPARITARLLDSVTC